MSFAHVGQLAFDLAPPRARRRDPRTSRDAADSMRRAATAQAATVLRALRDGGPAGATSIAARCGLTQVQVCRRLSELADCGMARTTGETARTASGRAERVWRAAPCA